MTKDEAIAKLNRSFISTAGDFVEALEALGVVKFEEKQAAPEVLWCFPISFGGTSPPIRDEDLRNILDANGYQIWAV